MRFVVGQILFILLAIARIPISDTSNPRSKTSAGCLRTGTFEDQCRLQSIPPQIMEKTASAFLTRVHCFVSGTVQGVYYRDSTVLKASLLGLDGWVRNLKDGRVEFVAEGAKDSVDELVKWAWKGVEGAREVGLSNQLIEKRKVKNVEVVKEDAQPGGGIVAKFAGKGFLKRKTS